MPRKSIHLLSLLLALVALAPASRVQADNLTVTIAGIDQDLADAVRAHLVANQYAARQDVSETEARVLAQDAIAQAATALRPYGYYDAQVQTGINHRGSTWQLAVRINPGPQVRVRALDLQVPAAALQVKPVRDALRAFRPRVGEAINDASYEASKQALAAALQESGWLDARASLHRVAVTRADHSAVIELHYELGKRYRLGVASFTGSQFRPELLQRFVRWQVGDWYSQADLLALQQALSETDYFAIVDVQPQADAASEQLVPVQVFVAPAKRTVYSAGVFVGTDTGAGVRAGVRRRWLNRRGHTLDSQVLVAEHLRTGQIVYGIPRPGREQSRYQLGAGYRDEHTKSSLSRTFNLSVGETRSWHGFVRGISLQLLGGTFTVGARGRNVEVPGVERGQSVLIYPELSLSKQVADDARFVRDGYSINLVARAAPGIDTRFAQVRADATWITAPGQHDRIILRGHAGIVRADEFNRLPPQLRFFAGGDRSIRGYGYQAIGPRNSYGLVIGGHRLLVASATLEHYFGNRWGLAAFVDAGDAFDGAALHARIGAGLGLRWRSPLGLLRLDIGRPVGDRHEHATQLHVAIGPDL